MPLHPCQKITPELLTLVEQIILSVHDNTSSNHDVPQRLTTAVCTEKTYRIRVVSEYMRKRDDEHAIQKRT